MDDALLNFLDEFGEGMYNCYSPKIRDRNRGVCFPPSPKGGLKYVINRKTNKMRRSTSTASPVDDGGPSSSASLASTVYSSNFDELLVDVESVPKHLGTDCPDLVEVAKESSDLLRVCYNHDHKANLPVEPSTAVPTPELRGPIPQRSSNVIVKRKAGQGHAAEPSPASVVKNARPKVWEQMEEPAKRICGLVPSSRESEGEIPSPLPNLRLANVPLYEEMDYEMDYRTTINRKVRTSKVTTSERPALLSPKTPTPLFKLRDPKTPRKEIKAVKYGDISSQKLSGNSYLGKRRLSTDTQTMLTNFHTPAKVAKKTASSILSQLDKAKLREEMEAQRKPSLLSPSEEKRKELDRPEKKKEPEEPEVEEVAQFPPSIDELIELGPKIAAAVEGTLGKGILPKKGISCDGRAPTKDLKRSHFSFGSNQPPHQKISKSSVCNVYITQNFTIHIQAEKKSDSKKYSNP